MTPAAALAAPLRPFHLAPAPTLPRSEPLCTGQILKASGMSRPPRAAIRRDRPRIREDADHVCPPCAPLGVAEPAGAALSARRGAGRRCRAPARLPAALRPRR